MKYLYTVGLLLFVSFAGICQQKAASKPNKPKTTAVTPAGKQVAAGSSCLAVAVGIHLMVSGKDYDSEGVTDANGTAMFSNVPAGDMVITKTGADNTVPSCRFVLACPGAAKANIKSGTFDDLTKGIGFRMPLQGSLVFSVR